MSCRSSRTGNRNKSCCTQGALILLSSKVYIILTTPNLLNKTIVAVRTDSVTLIFISFVVKDVLFGTDLIYVCFGL